MSETTFDKLPACRSCGKDFPSEDGYRDQIGNSGTCQSCMMKLEQEDIEYLDAVIESIGAALGLEDREAYTRLHIVTRRLMAKTAIDTGKISR